MSSISYGFCSFDLIICNNYFVCLFLLYIYPEQKGLTPEEVAADGRRDDVVAFLRQQREDASGQFAYRDEKCNANIWIGDQVIF